MYLVSYDFVWIHFCFGAQVARWEDSVELMVKDGLGKSQTSYKQPCLELFLLKGPRNP